MKQWYELYVLLCSYHIRIDVIPSLVLFPAQPAYIIMIAKNIVCCVLLSERTVHNYAYFTLLTKMLTISTIWQYTTLLILIKVFRLSVSSLHIIKCQLIVVWWCQYMNKFPHHWHVARLRPPGKYLVTKLQGEVIAIRCYWSGPSYPRLDQLQYPFKYYIARFCLAATILAAQIMMSPLNLLLR